MHNREREVTSDRRLCPRQNGGPAVVEIECGERTAGEILDHSTGGMALAVRGPARVGTRMRVRPAAEPDAQWAEVEVRHGRPGAGGWLLGCRYSVAPMHAIVAALIRSCAVLRLPDLMPGWFRAFAVGRLADVCPAAVVGVRSMADADLRRLYAAVRAAA